MRVSRPITRLASDGQPARHVIFDTEATIEREGDRHVQSWALGAAAMLDWTAKGARRISEPVVYGDPAALWDAILAFHRPGGRLVVWAHNLAYDLRLSRALELLPRAGYAMTGIVLADHGGWASFKHDRGSIICCDLTSWINAPLATIASDLGVEASPPLTASPSESGLADRCSHDVTITALAVGELMEWLRRSQLGPFRPTGAGQSHAAWRRRFLTEAVAVHDDVAALAHERRAMWTGRCEAWRHGRVDGPGLVEFDMNLAYCRIAAAEGVPCELLKDVTAPTVAEYLRWRTLGAVLARVTVTTTTPLVPAEDGERIHWPIGRFETVLWQPEIDLLLARGARVEFDHVWLYRRRPALAAIATWIIDRLEHPDPADGLLVRRLLKHWSRTIVGRMALRYRSWEASGRHPYFDLGLMLMVDLESGRTTEQLQVGHDLFELAELAEADASAPMVVGWVMSRCRVRLWELIEAAGVDRVLYMDTDSLLVDARGGRRLAAAIAAGEHEHLAVKGTYRSVTIHGPRQLDLDDDSRYSGVSKRSRRSGPLEFESERWSGIAADLAGGRADRVTVEHVPVRITGKDPRRHHLPGGLTAPHNAGG